MTEDTWKPSSPFECPECGRVLKNQAGLLSHIKTHTPKPISGSEPEDGNVSVELYTTDMNPIGPHVGPQYINIPVTVLQPDETLDQATGQIVKKVTMVHPAPEPQPTPRFDTVPEEEILNPTQDNNELRQTMTYNEYLERMRSYGPTGWGSAMTGAAPQVPTGQVMTGTVSLTPPPDLLVKIKKLPHYRDLPDLKKATPGSAAFDLYAAIDNDIVIGIDDWQLIPTGICMELPPGWWGLCAPRSGLAAKDGMTVLNTPGVIDSDYRGEIKVNLVNHTTKKFVVKPGMRICQIMFQRVYEAQLVVVDELSETSRGTGGFGSTGRF